jgi:hypothetical protein
MDPRIRIRTILSWIRYTAFIVGKERAGGDRYPKPAGRHGAVFVCGRHRPYHRRHQRGMYVS